MYCGSKLYYEHFKATNSSFYREEQIERLWNNPHLEFLCCFCYSSNLARQILIIKGGDNVRECCFCGKEVTFTDYIKYDGVSMEKTVFVWSPKPPESSFNKKTSIKKERKNDKPKIYCKECYIKKKREKFYERYGKYMSKWSSQLSKTEQLFLN